MNHLMLNVLYQMENFLPYGGDYASLVEKIGTFVRCESSKQHASSWNYPIYLER